MRILLSSGHNQIRWFRLEHFVCFNNSASFIGIPCQHQRQISQQTNLCEISQGNRWILNEKISNIRLGVVIDMILAVDTHLGIH